MYNVFFVLHQVLAARVFTAGKSLSQLRGTTVVNGQRRVESKFRKISAYVLQVFILQYPILYQYARDWHHSNQDENMSPHLTIFETLMPSAHFFLLEELSDEEKTFIVNAVIAELGLIKAKEATKRSFCLFWLWIWCMIWINSCMPDSRCVWRGVEESECGSAAPTTHAYIIYVFMYYICMYMYV